MAIKQIQSHDEKTKARPNGTTQEKEVKTEESHDLRSGVVQEEEVHLKIPKDLRRKGQEEKRTKGNLRTRKGGGQFNIGRRDIQDTTSRNKTTNEISGGGDWNYKAKSTLKPLVSVQFGIIELQQGKHMFRRI